MRRPFLHDTTRRDRQIYKKLLEYVPLEKEKTCMVSCVDWLSIDNKKYEYSFSHHLSVITILFSFLFGWLPFLFSMIDISSQNVDTYFGV